MNDFILCSSLLHPHRLKILQYFDGPNAVCPKIPVCCDNCRLASNNRDHEKEMDFSKDAKILFDAINLFGGSTGLAKPIAVLRGSKAKTVERYHNHKLMASGGHQSEQYWKLFADLLERKGLLEKQHVKGNGKFSYTTVNVTRQGRDWLVSNKPFVCVPSEQLFHLITSEKNAPPAKPLYDTSSASTASNGTLSVHQLTNKPKSDEELKRSLLVVRAMIATREGTMPYKIASEPAIDRLVQIQPLNLQELRNAKVDGFSEALVNQFGPEFLKCIQRSKGLLPQTSSENMVSYNQIENLFSYFRFCVDFLQEVPTGKVAADKSPAQHEATSIQSDHQKLLEDDDDDLFMNLEFDGEKVVEVPSAPKSAPPVGVRAKVTTTFSKRVKYENSSSDEDTPPSKSKPGGSQHSTAQNPPKPVGIRKRNIF